MPRRVGGKGKRKKNKKRRLKGQGGNESHADSNGTLTPLEQTCNAMIVE